MLENQTIIVGIGDYKIGKAPSCIRTTLGSCIAVCLYDTVQKIGGMLHIMMASSSVHTGTVELRRAKYADTGIPDLIGALQKNYNVIPKELKAKIFGGAKILKMVSQDIGKSNEEAARRILKDYGIRIMAAKTGGDKGYQVDFILENGMVECRVFGENCVSY